MGFGIFISYNRADKRIATELQSCLVALSESINVFIDHASIVAGDDYEQMISQSIKQSTWFILVNPGIVSSEKDLGWCFYEAGQFRNKLSSSAMPTAAISERVCVIYDVDIPSQLNRYQAVRVQDREADGRLLNLDVDNDAIENTAIFALFVDILQKSEKEPIRDLSKPPIRKLVRDQARRFITTFLRGQTDAKLSEVALQRRISLILPPKPVSQIDPNTEVLGWERALSELFGIAGAKASWADLKAAFRLESGADAIWIEDLENGLLAVANGLVPEQSEMLCHAKGGGFFRPVIARYVPFVSGRREVYIAFLPVQRRSIEPKESKQTFGIIPKQHILLMSLLFAFRFKQRVLPLIDSISQAARDNGRFSAMLTRIEREVVILENEAEEFGFQISRGEWDQVPTIGDAISDGADRATIEDMNRKWFAVRRRLVTLLSDVRNPRSQTSAADVSGDVLAGLAALKPINKVFTEIVIREIVKSELLELSPAA